MIDKTCWVFGCKMGTGSLEYLKMWKNVLLGSLEYLKMWKNVLLMGV